MLKFLSPVIRRFENLKANAEHKALLLAIVKSLEGLEEDAAALKLELVITTARGTWLDTWGDWFGVPRLPNEEDRPYSRRIVSTTIKPKNTIPAIIAAINEVGNYTGNDTTIFEPHNFIARHSMSKFSGRDRYTDSSYWRSGVIDINIPFEFTEEIRNTMESVKSAGIKAYYTFKMTSGMELDDWKFSDEFTPYEDYTLYVQPALSISLKGAVFSSNTSGARNRSGKQTIWGHYLDLGFDIPLTRNFERFYAESATLRPEDVMVEKLLPFPKGFKFSVRRPGVLSGGFRHGKEYESLLDESGKTDLQSPVIRNVFELRPATRSHHGVLSGRFGLSGAPDGGWEDKPFVIAEDNLAIYEYPSIRTRQSTTILTELTLKQPSRFNKSKRSGNQILYASDLFTLSTDLTMSKQKRILTFNDPYKWTDFMYAVRIGDETLQNEILGSAVQNWTWDSNITVDEIEEWGVNIQKPTNVEVIAIGLPYRSLNARRSGKFGFSGVFGDKSDPEHTKRPLLAEKVDNPYSSTVSATENVLYYENEIFPLHVPPKTSYTRETGLTAIARRPSLMSSAFTFEDLSSQDKTFITVPGGAIKGHTSLVDISEQVLQFVDYQAPVNIKITN